MSQVRSPFMAWRMWRPSSGAAHSRIARYSSSKPRKSAFIRISPD
ncbi:Uncharacterised protein [Bordetella pertussis]|nr:Uncharacterised protein [Bordetella pertussis]